MSTRILGEFLLLTALASAAHAQTVTYTLMKNGVATALSCTIGVNGTTCSDTADSISMADGDQLSMRTVASAAVTPTAISFSILYTPN